MTPAPGKRSMDPALLRAATENMAVVCAWCPELHIMKLQRKSTDVIEIMQEGAKRLVIRRNGVQLAVSHGICRSCSAAHGKHA